MRLIKVKYTKAHTAGLIGKYRDLDPDTGNVYEDGYSANCGFKRTAPGVWSNGLSELTEIGNAPTTATVSPWETQEGDGHYKGHPSSRWSTVWLMVSMPVSTLGSST